MALSPVSLTLKQKIFVISKNVFFNNDEKADMILVCGKNSVAAAVAYNKPMVGTSNTFYINLFILHIYLLFIC
jgi:hypothetical protein